MRGNDNNCRIAPTQIGLTLPALRLEAERMGIKSPLVGSAFDDNANIGQNPQAETFGMYASYTCDDQLQVREED